jgi:hypothetical protein
MTIPIVIFLLEFCLGIPAHFLRLICGLLRWKPLTFYTGNALLSSICPFVRVPILRICLGGELGEKIIAPGRLQPGA